LARTKTHYDLLDCPPASSLDALHAAYLELALKYHDKGDFAPEMSALTVAWGVLKDKKSRAAYDAKLRLERVLNCFYCKGAGLVHRTVRFTQTEESPCAKCGGTGRAK
jgi:DnaJ-class molecular chaperone